jgi:hypothetical protein
LRVADELFLGEIPETLGDCRPLLGPYVSCNGKVVNSETGCTIEFRSADPVRFFPSERAVIVENSGESASSAERARSDLYIHLNESTGENWVRIFEDHFVKFDARKMPLPEIVDKYENEVDILDAMLYLVGKSHLLYTRLFFKERDPVWFVARQDESIFAYLKNELDEITASQQFGDIVSRLWTMRRYSGSTLAEMLDQTGKNLVQFAASWIKCEYWATVFLNILIGKNAGQILSEFDDKYIKL